MPISTEVLRRARRGDETAFAEVVDDCGGLILNLAYRMVRDRQEAEDLAQEVFLRLFRVFDRYDPARPFLPWLRRVATNLMINLTSGKKRRMRRETTSLDAYREASGELPPDRTVSQAPVDAERAERAARLNATILQMKPEQRAILALHYYEGRSYDQIAEDLDLPLGTVKNRLFRAREALARALGGEQ
jgi:RNA polymerase sigma-70 factor, ECF subfamily